MQASAPDAMKTPPRIMNVALLRATPVTKKVTPTHSNAMETGRNGFMNKLCHDPKEAYFHTCAAKAQ